MSASRQLRSSIVEAIRLESVAAGTIVDITTHTGDAKSFLTACKALPNFINILGWTDPSKKVLNNHSAIVINRRGEHQSTINATGLFWLDTGEERVNRGSLCVEYGITIHAKNALHFDIAYDIVKKALPMYGALQLIDLVTETMTTDYVPCEFLKSMPQLNDELRKVALAETFVYKFDNIPSVKCEPTGYTYGKLVEFQLQYELLQQEETATQDLTTFDLEKTFDLSS